VSLRADGLWARAALVSPSDLLAACEQWERLQLGVVLRRTASGVAIAQLGKARRRHAGTARRLVVTRVLVGTGAGGGGGWACPATFRNDVIAERIRQLALVHGALTAEALAREERVSPVLALELLLVRPKGEGRGGGCCPPTC
jgi:hypothetical protein